MSIYDISAKPGKQGIQGPVSLNAELIPPGQSPSTIKRGKLEIFCMSDICMRSAEIGEVYTLSTYGKARIIRGAARETIECPRCGHAAFSSRNYLTTEETNARRRKGNRKPSNSGRR